MIPPFQHHVIDVFQADGMFSQTAAGDLDGDGRPEFVLGHWARDIWAYKMHEPSRWTKHRIGTQTPENVGLALFDVDGDGLIDVITGGVWYRNPGHLDGPWERIVYDAELSRVHDIVITDIDGDGRQEVVVMSDSHDLRWYRIGDDPRQPWAHITIGEACHAGLAVADLDGDGHMDVVRADVWFQNVRGDGTEWCDRPIGPVSSPPPDFRPPWAFNAARVRACDMDRDGRMDLVYTDAEIPGGKVWWMQNVAGDGSRWVRHDIEPGAKPRRGPYHSLVVHDFDGDGDLDVFSCEMEDIPGQEPPKWYLWENIDGRGRQWCEHVILDANLGGHEIVAADFTGNGTLDIVGKPWRPSKGNALDGQMYVLFLENLGVLASPAPQPSEDQAVTIETGGGS